MNHEDDNPLDYLDDPYALAARRGIVGGQRC